MTVTELKIQIIQKLIALLQQALALPSNSMQDTIYQTLKANIGKHCTLDDTVPPDVGCAEAVSFILRAAGIPVPSKGIAGTYALLQYALQHPEHFVEIYIPEESVLLISATGTGNGKLSNGHTAFFGIFGKQFSGDWGLVSNDSQTGLLLEHWSWKAWNTYYTQYAGFTPRLFRIKG